MASPRFPRKLSPESLRDNPKALATLKSLAEIVTQDPDLSETQRRDVRSDILCAERACLKHRSLLLQEGKLPPGSCEPPGTNPSYLNEYLLGRSPRVLGFSIRRHHNICRSVRWALRRFGLQPHKQNLWNGANEVWQRAAIASGNRFGQLSGFAIWCTARDLQPADVTADHLSAFQDWRMSNTLSRCAADSASRLWRTWKALEKTTPGWPAIRGELPKRNNRYTISRSEWPESLRSDEELFLRKLAHRETEDIFPLGCDADDFSRGRSRRALKPATIETRGVQIRIAVGALLNSGLTFEQIRTLQDLVDPLENAQKILMFLVKRLGRSEGTSIAGPAEILRQIAKYHCRLPDEHVRKLARWASTARGKQQMTMTPKNRHKLRAISDPHTRALLLHAPRNLMREAEALQLPKRATRLARTALAVELLQVVPMRVCSLRNLRLGEHLICKREGSNQYTHLHVPGAETKNGVPIDWELPSSTVKLIKTYLERFREAESGNSYLFPGEGNKPIATTTMATYFRETLAQFIGAEINPHLMRHLAALLFLEANPGAYEMASRVLGHKNVQTTTAFYCGLEVDAASRRYDEVVLRARKTAAGASRHALAKRRSSRTEERPHGQL